MASTYTGQIRKGLSTVTAVWHNVVRGEDFHMDERDLRDYIGVTDENRKIPYVVALIDLQTYKTKNGIPLDTRLYQERVI